MAFKVKRGKLSWQLQIYNGINPKTGEKDYIKETFKAPKIDPETGKKITQIKAEKLADLRLAELETDLKRQEYIEPSKMTFYEFLTERFLPAAKTQITSGTYEEYEMIVRRHILKEYIAQVPLTKLELQHIEDYKIKKLNSISENGKKLSPKTVRNQMIVIKAACAYACKLRILKYNPAQYAEYPYVPKSKPNCWTEDQAAKFLEAAQNDRFYFLYLMAIFYGKRKGELRGLRWQDIDLKAMTASIRQSVRKSGYMSEYKDTKTEESSQMLDLESWMLPYFKLERNRRRMEKLYYGPGYNDNNLVFASPNGNPVKERTLNQHFQKIVEGVGLPLIRIHDLRHSCVTIMLKRGWSMKFVQERGGWADIETPAKIYLHVTHTMQKEVNEDMTKALKLDILQKDYQKDSQNDKIG